MSYLRNEAGIARRTPQSEPIPGRTDQVKNSASGYVFAVDAFARLRRWLVLGSEGPTFYASERDLTRENVDGLRTALAEDGLRAVEEIASISESGRAPKNDPAIFALALAASVPDEATRRAALDALPRVCRIGTHLLHFNAFVEQFRGRGPALNRAVREWFTREDVDAVAYQLVKYRSRDDWSQRDLLRLVKPKPPSPAHDALFGWVVGKDSNVMERIERGDIGSLPLVVQVFERAQAAKTARESAALIRKFGGLLPREALRTDHLNSPEVWDALLPTMPLTALIRNLPTMTRHGVIAPLSDGAAFVVERLRDEGALRKSRIHPLNVLTALLTYASGRSIRGSSSWTPVTQIVDALDACFYAAFGNVEPTGKRHLLALDVSGSMNGGAINGVPGLTPRVASAAMALVLANSGDPFETIAFTGSGGHQSYGGYYSTPSRTLTWTVQNGILVPPGQPIGGPAGVTPPTPDQADGLNSDGMTSLTISPRQRLDDVCRITNGLPYGATDCALPWVWATRHDRKVDVCVTFTDSESWVGPVHATQALREYRRKSGIEARSIVCAMVANQYSVADPQDPLQLDVVGFDASAPAIISEFAAGRI
jgi:60 kDa SS-A/Ro ribonucleoprotein